ncbi:MAG: alpha-D-ribose 1-methylphosphonate 5-triphosphate diphosphatase [Candidatus Brachytrichaceae bacterium NZ_4S206]|jgi:alpha-D-ribose 1-methylphosphonate 5-triphosphate diphosphatase
MWLSDLKIVLPDRVLERGSIRIEGERIAEVIEGPAPRSDWDLRGITLLPGIIDMHGDMIEREIEPRPGVHLPFDLALIELDKRLAANGVTTAYAAISFAELWDKRELRREERAREIVSAIYQHRDALLADMRVHARFEVTNRRAPPVLLELIAAGQVDLVSINDHTPGQGQYRDLEKYIQTIAEWRSVSADTVAAMTQERIAQMRDTPPAWDIVREVTTLSARHRLPIASHDDDTRQKVAFMAEMGATISEFPVTLEAAEEAKRRGMHVVMGAPNALRGGSHSGNLSALDAIAAGLVDMLAADYHPAALLQAVYALARRGALPLHAAIRLITRNVAEALGLRERGVIAERHYADLAFVEEGPLRPRVRGAMRNGHFIYVDRALAARGDHALH